MLHSISINNILLCSIDVDIVIIYGYHPVRGGGGEAVVDYGLTMWSVVDYGLTMCPVQCIDLCSQTVCLIM